MYSFYRAWLMRDAFTSTIGNPPDVIVQVGPSQTQFTAHRAVLASHSGYFKSVFAHPTNPVVVNNIGVAEFTSLLTWMYTGYLDLNIENIYNILLATHLLHMPNALEICRNFLVQNNQLVHENNRLVNNEVAPYSSYNNVVKPIPSRKYLPDAFRFEPVIRYQQPNLLQNSDSTIFHKVENLLKSDKDNKPSNEDDAKISMPSTSFTRKTPSPSVRSLSPNLSENSESVVQYQTSKKLDSKRLKKNPDAIKNGDSKVIIDIACCDGPVRFHRVLNNCYGVTNVIEKTETESRNKNEIMNKIMTENINRDENNRKCLSSERKLSVSTDGSEQGNSDKSENQNDIVYTCVYCNHTFKSQYCYQKHARRHINPVTLNSTCKAEKNVEVKREVKLLDMNVQYYPCKTCGSKFPSYYFVHKHRKLHHAEEMVGEKEIIVTDSNDEKSNTQNDIETNKTADN